jgi:hypothetical protein
MFLGCRANVERFHHQIFILCIEKIWTQSKNLMKGPTGSKGFSAADFSDYGDKAGPDERRLGPPEAASGGAGSHPGVPLPRPLKARQWPPWVEPMLEYERPNHWNHRNQWQKQLFSP